MLAQRGPLGWDFWRRLSILALPSTVVVLAAAAFVYEQSLDSARTILLEHQRALVARGAGVLAIATSTVLSDLEIRSQEPSMRAWVERPSPATLEQLTRDLLLVSRARGLYDQIRVIALDGQELIRINLNDGAPSVVAAADLQNKSDRAYVRQARTLPPGAAFVSNLDLNVEHGAIERPLKPTLRLATLLFDAKGEPRALLVLNFDARRMLTWFRSLAQGERSELHLLDTQGDWISAPNPDLNFGRLLAHGESFARRYPDMWEQMSGDPLLQSRVGSRWMTARSTGPFDDSFGGGTLTGGAYPFRLVYEGNQRPVWHVVALATEQQVAAASSAARASVAGFAAIVLLAVLGGCAWVAFSWQSTDNIRTRLLRLLDAMPIGITAYDNERALLYANPQAEALLGQSAVDRAQASPQWLRSDGSTLPLEETPLARVLATHRPLSGFIVGVARRRPLPPQWFQVEAFPEIDNHNSVLRVYVMYVDVTEARHADEDKRAALTAEQSNRAKSAFLSRLSHELRTPLNAMLGFTQLMVLDPQAKYSPEQRQRLSVIESSGHHLLALVNDALDLARIEQGQIAMSIDTVRLADLLAECESVVSRQAAQWGVTVRREPVPEEVYVRADRVRLQQVIINLLTNAIKYNKRGGLVELRIELVNGERVRLHVTDTGPGMSEADVAKLFQPFERLGAERSAVEGSGLGLSICKNLVELMHGAIDVESHLGKGTDMRVTLPRANAPANPPPPAAADSETAAVDQPPKRTILYIEDNSSNAQLMEGIIRSQPGLTLRVAATGEAGLAQVRAHPPHLVLCDINLPDISGHDVCAAIRNDPRLAKLVLIAVTADASESARGRALKAGFDYVVTKPIELRAFLRLLRSLLET